MNRRCNACKEDCAVPRDEIFSQSELAFLEELQRRRVRFLVVGLSAATLQGVPVVTQDVDLWFAKLGEPRMVAAVKAVDGFYTPATAYTPPQLGGERVKLYDLVTGMHGLKSFATEYRNAKTVKIGKLCLKVLPLERIIASKRAANRRKDLLTLPVLEDAVTTLAERKRRRSKR
jgi:predicted nucleotidyltransferase